MLINTTKEEISDINSTRKFQKNVTYVYTTCEYYRKLQLSKVT